MKNADFNVLKSRKRGGQIIEVERQEAKWKPWQVKLLVCAGCAGIFACLSFCFGVSGAAKALGVSGAAEVVGLCVLAGTLTMVVAISRVATHR